MIIQTRSSTMRTYSMLWISVVWTLVPGCLDALTINVPERIHAVVKRYRHHEVIVDRVSAPRYRALNVTMSRLTSGDCGHFDFLMDVDYCDCRDAAVHEPPRVVFNYTMSFYVHRGLAYFSPTLNGAHAVVEDVGRVPHMTVSLPVRLLKSHKEVRYYGPVKTTGRPPTQDKRLTILPERAFREWAQQEISEEIYQTNFWNREWMRWRDSESTSPQQPDNRVRVTFAGGPTVDFAGNECYKLETGDGFAASGLTVDRGGCALAHPDERCSGRNSHIFVQQPSFLYSAVVGHSPSSAESVAKSVSGCCRRQLYLSPRDGWRQPASSSNHGDWHGFCSCSSSRGSDPASAVESTEPERTRANKTTGAGELKEFDEDDLAVLDYLYARASDELTEAIKAAVSVATADTPEARTAMAGSTASAVTAVYKIVNASLDTLYGKQLYGKQTVRILEEIVDSAAESVRELTESEPEDAARYAITAALMATCLPPFMYRSAVHFEWMENLFGVANRFRREVAGDVEKRPAEDDGERERQDDHTWDTRDEILFLLQVVTEMRGKVFNGTRDSCTYSDSDGAWKCDQEPLEMIMFYVNSMLKANIFYKPATRLTNNATTERNV